MMPDPSMPSIHAAGGGALTSPIPCCATAPAEDSPLATINGNMIAGIGLIAVPAVYGETGRTTFLVSHHGQIWQKDLGDRTEVLGAAIQSFAVDDSWDEVAP